MPRQENICMLYGFVRRCESSSNYFIRSLQTSDAFYKFQFFRYYLTLLYNVVGDQGRNQLFISGGTIFINFHSMASSWLFNRGTTFSQTVTKFSRNIPKNESLLVLNQARN